MQWYSASQATQTQRDKIYTSNSFIIKSGLLYWKSHIETQMLPHRIRVITKWDGDYKWKRPNECKQRQNQQLYTKNKICDSLITEDINCKKLQNGREMRRAGQQRRQITCEKDPSVGYNSKWGIKRDKNKVRDQMMTSSFEIPVWIWPW